MPYAPRISDEYLPTDRMNFDIIERIKLPPVEVVQEDSRIVWRMWVDQYQRGRQKTTTGCDKQQRATEWTGTTVRHLNSIGQVKLIIIM